MTHQSKYSKRKKNNTVTTKNSYAGTTSDVISSILLIASASIILCALSYRLSFADSIKILGVDLDMPKSAFEQALQDRGYECPPPPTPPESSGRIIDLMLCTSPPTPEKLKSLQPNIDSVDKLLSQSFDSLIDNPSAAINDTKFQNNTESALLSLEGIIQNFRLIISYKTLEKQYILFSCSVFSSCGRPKSEVITSIKRDISFISSDLLLTRPNILTDIYLELINTQQQKEIDEILKITTKETLNFTEELSPCFYKEGDRLCVYDGRITLDALSLSMNLGIEPQSAETVNFLSSISIATPIFILERGDYAGPPSFK
ncbi:hypothetical protein [Sedimentimonas flavescens]|uniref:hypothetical protein n=1 Tax=Sedimentimonas flavescens TaxID=2851012 RepID=UPI001C49D30B|nr:hypothetical protein [Sedimentimonas flavescens]MBW0159632.1 hypothetical protein [Sedimentimonas flavescens]